MFFKSVPVFIAAAVLAALPAKAQLSARQLFYDDGAKKTASPAKPSEVKPIVTPAPTPPKPKKAANTKKPLPPKVEVPERVELIKPMEPKVGPPLVTVQSKPLAVRYSILKEVATDEWLEVDADSGFRSGDRIRLQVEGNQNGYMYIFSKGTSGTWKTLFPSEEVEDGDNRVRPRRPVLYPNENQAYRFNDKPGVEEVFLAFSRNPDEDFDKLIYDVNRGSTTAKRMMIAGGKPIKDSMIDRLKVQSRDLVIETVKEKPAPSNKPKAGAADRMSETAVYVASPDQGLNAKVIAQIRLKHD